MTTALSELKQLTEDEQPAHDVINLVRPLIQLCKMLAEDSELDKTVTARVAGLDLALVLVEYTKTLSVFEPHADR